VFLERHAGDVLCQNVKLICDLDLRDMLEIPGVGAFNQHDQLGLLYHFGGKLEMLQLQLLDWPVSMLFGQIITFQDDEHAFSILITLQTLAENKTHVK
jgi:hypothetical protein